MNTPRHEQVPAAVLRPVSLIRRRDRVPLAAAIRLSVGARRAATTGRVDQDELDTHAVDTVDARALGSASPSDL